MSLLPMFKSPLNKVSLDTNKLSTVWFVAIKLVVVAEIEYKLSV